MSIGVILIAIFGGLIAGFINTLAGNGSAITLTILTELIGLPPNVANGTNRIGVFSQCLTSVPIFLKNNPKAIRKGRRLILWIVLGAFLGIWLAVTVSNEQFRTVFSYLMIAILVVLLIKPKRWLITTDADYNLPMIVEFLMYLGIGFYAGFIQMGMGVIFLIVTVLIARYNIIDANAIKNIAVTLLTVVALIIFHLKGLLDWKVGLIVSIGQASGGWLAATFATTHEKASLWAYRLLLVIVIFAIIKLFNLHQYIL